jgi:hypothetical protein
MIKLTMKATSPNAAFKRVRRSGDKAAKRFISMALINVQNRGRDNALVGPTLAQYVSTLKGGKTKRRSIQTGDLERSITQETASDGMEGKVFVPGNSGPGMKGYAKKLHDERGKTWRKRGPGTRHKGPQAREKYLTRAKDEYARRDMIEDANDAVAWALKQALV